MYDDYCWREKRCNLYRMGLFPIFVNTKRTELPTGNAHWSLYALGRKDAENYMKLGSRKHKIYEHYSERGLRKIIQICDKNNWSFSIYDTGSGNGGGHVSIVREAEPSEHLYIRDKMFVEKYFEGVPDIDMGIYTPMHLIRGIGKVHEKSGKCKVLVRTVLGNSIPDVTNISLYTLLLERHNRQKLDFKSEAHSDWTKFQNSLIRHNPTNIGPGNRHLSLYCLGKDLCKAGLGHNACFEILKFFNSQFEDPHSDDKIERALNQAFVSVKG
jgi:hypothetical protein